MFFFFHTPILFLQHNPMICSPLAPRAYLYHVLFSLHFDIFNNIFNKVPFLLWFSPCPYFCRFFNNIFNKVSFLLWFSPCPYFCRFFYNIFNKVPFLLWFSPCPYFCRFFNN